jgi:hypothetical protein
MSSTENKGNDFMKKGEEKAKSWGFFSNPKEEAVCVLLFSFLAVLIKFWFLLLAGRVLRESRSPFQNEQRVGGL